MSGSPFGRVVEIAENGRYLAKHRGFLTVSANGADGGRVPLDDIAAVIATSPATSASCFLLAELAERGIPFVVCDRNFSPAGILWPIRGHHAQQRRMEAQITATRPLAKKLWATIVAEKIRRQGWALARTGQPAGAFLALARDVRSGDPDNIEAQAARRYWPLFFGPAFRRDADGSGANALLNYGYAVLRAATARAIVAAGLHPGVGIFHRHPHNPMPLADDLMEPFRPFFDVAVRKILAGGDDTVSAGAKRCLVEVLWHAEATAAGMTPLSTSILRFAQSVAESFLMGEAVIELPFCSPQTSPSDIESDPASQ
jgi:CRISPR-associated protein Cas1